MTINRPALELLLADEPETLAILDDVLKKIETKNKRIFAVSGKKGSGKDTFADALASYRGHDFVYEAFARPVKEEAGKMFADIGRRYKHESIAQIGEFLIEKYNLEDIHGVNENIERLVIAVIDDLNNGITPHPYERSPGAWASLRILGTDIRRAKDEDYWVKKTLVAICSAVNNGNDVYIVDARFPNELESAMMLDATTIRMLITPEVQAERLYKRDGTWPTEEALNHPSETSLDDRDDFDFFIDNNGGIGLEDNVDRVAHFI